MNQQEKDFYQELFPFLAEEWQHNEGAAYGQVRWWRSLPSITVEDVSASVRVGLILRPNSYELFAQIRGMDYPEFVHSETLFRGDVIGSVRPHTDTSIARQALETAASLLQKNLPSIRQARAEWLAEIDRAR